jgi:hypothetical protein
MAQHKGPKKMLFLMDTLLKGSASMEKVEQLKNRLNPKDDNIVSIMFLGGRGLAPLYTLFKSSSIQLIQLKRCFQEGYC